MLKLVKTHEVAQSVIIQVKGYDPDYVENVLNDMCDWRSGGEDVMPQKGGPMEWVRTDDDMGRLRVTWTRGHDGPTASQYRKDMQPRLQKMYPDARITIRRDPLPRVRTP